jgi:hypothetical protein
MSTEAILPQPVIAADFRWAEKRASFPPRVALRVVAVRPCQRSFCPRPA